MCHNGVVKGPKPSTMQVEWAKMTHWVKSYHLKRGGVAMRLRHTILLPEPVLLLLQGCVQLGNQVLKAVRASL